MLITFFTCHSSEGPAKLLHKDREPGENEPPPSVVSEAGVLADDDAMLDNLSISDATSPRAVPSASARSKALSLASAAKSKIAQSGRRMLSPLGAGSTSSKATRSASMEIPPPAPASASDGGPSIVPPGLTALASGTSSAFTSLLFPSSSSSSAPSLASTIASSMPSIPTPEEMEAQEAALAAEAAAAELRQISAQQRMQILEALVQARRFDWSYLKAMHEGTNYWLNIALMGEQQLLAHLGEKQTIRRSQQFFYLGLGLGKLIGESTHPELLATEGCQLLEELEFYFSSSTVQSMKIMVATSSTLHEPVNDAQDHLRYSLNEPFRPTLYKWNQKPVFRRLQTPAVPFALDYREVMLSLCDILAIVYSKLVEDNNSSENIYLFLAILRFDERIKKLVIDPVRKEFSALATLVLTKELREVRKNFASGSEPTASSPPPSDTRAGKLPNSPPPSMSSPPPST